MDINHWFDSLLNRCAILETPDYLTFYHDINKMLGTIIPAESICNLIAVKACEVYDRLKEYQKSEDQNHEFSSHEIPDYMTTFHKLRLLDICAKKLSPDLKQNIARSLMQLKLRSN